MNSCMKTLTYMLRRFKNSYLIFIGILFGLNVFIKVVGLIAGAKSQVNSAQDAVFLIFVFVNFIAAFREAFNHMSMNGVTRKAFFHANSIFIVFVSVIMVITSYILSRINDLIGIRSDLLLEMVYRSSFLKLLVLGICYSILAGFVGWLFSLLTYRFGNYMILIIIFVPQLILTAVGAIVSKADKIQEFSSFLMYYFGLSNGVHPLTAGANLLLTAIAVALIDWVFMRKMPVKV